MKTIKPPIMLIEDFLPSGCLMGLTSYPGVGKSWLAFEIMRAITTGTDFLGQFKVNIRGPVLFVGSDSSEFDYARQWTRLTREVPNAELNHAWFLCQSPFMLDDDEEVSRLIKTSLGYVVEQNVTTEHEDEETGEVYSHTADRTNFELIIFDTLSRLSRKNQNDNTEMEEVFRNIRDIAEATGAAVLVLHHNSKPSEHNDGGDWRGAMSQIGALDSWLQLVKPKKIVSGGSQIIGAQFKKFRGITPPDFSFNLDVNDPERASLSLSDVAVTNGQRFTADPLAMAIEELVRVNGGLTCAAYRNVLWPQFESESKSKGAFTVAVENRFRALVTSGTLTKSKNEEGKPVYEVPKPHEASADA
jgi:hypothetical protein